MIVVKRSTGVVSTLVVGGAIAVIYEITALSTRRCETLTDHCAKRDKTGILTIAYAVLLLLHVITGGRV